MTTHASQSETVPNELYRELWEGVDLNEILALAERYLDTVPLTAERAILKALLIKVRRLENHPLQPIP